jgi:hypothetical protein
VVVADVNSVLQLFHRAVVGDADDVSEVRIGAIFNPEDVLLKRRQTSPTTTRCNNSRTELTSNQINGSD